jgi:hypothetical protein
MEFSYNGAPASRDPKAIGVRPFSAAGVSFPGGVRAGEVAVILAHVAREFNDRVERLKKGWCWGWSYRKNRNANNLSVHSAGEAIDANAPAHPNGIPAFRNFSDEQIDEIHLILSEVDELDQVVHWGGDWTGTPDPMHFEIHDHNDTARIHRVYLRIKQLRKERNMNEVQKGRVELDKMLAYGERALEHFDAVPKKRVAVKAFATTLRYSLRVLRAAYPKVPKS